ncbi:putative quinol monooxygenase [Haloarchaeobius litoreus]|uniref:Quinol monooxygenase n=1 Tax=Haloarchaeobius litoreus TaxID=755306 RepID=A0ABD6DM15_9EURY|nr:antibiotic biosynthesis monooxygenase [Haloarchaeobius litoreus]
MTYLLGKASVENFDEWKSAFDGFEDFRTDHGQQGYQVFQSVDDPHEAVVLFEWADGEDPRAFFASEEMQERLEEAGVKGQPELTELEFIEQKSTQHPSA